MNDKYVSFLHVYDDFGQALPELRKYKFPSRSGTDEEFCVRELCSKIRDETPDGIRMLHLANGVMASATPNCPCPAWFADEWPRMDDILNAIYSQNYTKSPGFPGTLLYPTKGEVIHAYLPDLVQACFARFVCLRYIAPHCVTAEDYYHTFCADHLSVSIKGEAVKLEKDGRIISALSIVSAVVEKVIYGAFNEEFKLSVYETYSAIGIGFTKYDSRMMHLAAPKISFVSDVPTFDSSVTLKENRLTVKMVFNRYGVSPDHPVYKMALELERVFMLSTFVFSHGKIFAQTKAGYQKSGRDETANFNTIARARRSMAVDLYLHLNDSHDLSECMTICAGDDCCETPHPYKEAVYNSLGFPLRDSSVTEDLDFCSHSWPVDAVPVGKRIWKSLFKLLVANPIQYDQFQAFCREYSSHECFQAILSAISARRPEMKFLIERMRLENFQRSSRFLNYLECAKKKKNGKKVVVITKKVVSKKTSSKKQSMGGMHVPMALTMGVCSVTNPFCPEAIGARWPDNSFTKSVGWSITSGSTTMSTDANGKCSQLFVGELGGCTAAGTITGSTAAFGNLAAVANQTVSGNVERYRLTSWGLKVNCVQSRMTAAGMLRIRMTSPLGGSSLAGFTINTVNCDFVLDSPLSRYVDKDIFLIPMPLGINAREFRNFEDTVNTLSTWVNPGWQAIVVSIDGAPVSTPVAQVSAYYNYELIFADGDSMNSFSHAPPQDSPVIRDANAGVLSRIGNAVEGTASFVDKVVSSKAMQYLVNGIAYLDPRAKPAAVAINGYNTIRAIKDVD